MLVVMGVTFFTSRVVLASLGETDYGIYGAVGGVVTMFTFISGSLSASTSRFLTYELGRNDSEALSHTFSAALNLHLIAALFILLIGETLGAWFLYEKMTIPEARMDAAYWILQFSIITTTCDFILVPFRASFISHENMSLFAYIGLYEAFSVLIIAYLIQIGDADRLVFLRSVADGQQNSDSVVPHLVHPSQICRMPHADSQGEGFVYQAAELLWMEYVRSRGIAVARAGDKHRAEYVLRSGGQCRPRTGCDDTVGIAELHRQLPYCRAPKGGEAVCRGQQCFDVQAHVHGVQDILLLDVRPHHAAGVRDGLRAPHMAGRQRAAIHRHLCPHHPRSGAGRVVPFGIPHGFPCHRQDEDGQHGVRLVDDPYAPCRIHRLEDGASALFGVRHHPCQQRRLPRVQLGVNAPLCAVQLLAACHGGLSALHIGDPLRPACAGIRPCQYAARLASLSGFVAMQRAGLRPLHLYVWIQQGRERRTHLPRLAKDKE